MYFAEQESKEAQTKQTSVAEALRIKTKFKGISNKTGYFFIYYVFFSSYSCK
jgi:hypothetical protein